MEWNFKLRKVPNDLQRQAKIAAATKGQTLNDFVIEAIRAAVGTLKPSAKK